MARRGQRYLDICEEVEGVLDHVGVPGLDVLGAVLGSNDTRYLRTGLVWTMACIEQRVKDLPQSPSHRPARRIRRTRERA
jgi:hypothetical protein